MGEQEASIASAVRSLVDADPCLRECLRRRLVNLSEAARQLRRHVEEALGKPVSLDAVKSALARYAERLRQQPTTSLGFLEVLARSSVELRAPVTVAVLSLEALPRIAEKLPSLAGRARMLLVLQSYTNVTVVADSDTISRLLEFVDRSALVELWERQAAIVIVSPRDVVETPGFVAHITGLLASHKINIQQIESVHTDTVIIVSSNDALKAYQLIVRAVEQARTATAPS